MIQERILKIIKGLSTFSLDDIASMSDFEEEDILDILIQLERDGTIIKTSEDEYIYVSKVPERSKSIQLIEKPEIQTISDNNITFKQAAQHFLTTYAIKKCTPSTFKTYISIAKVHLIPFFGEMILKNILQNEIKEFICLKQRQHLSNRRIKNCVTLLGTMFNKFKEWKFILDSPYNGIINVKFQQSTNLRILNETEVNSLLQKAKIAYPKIYPLVFLAASTGLKRAEILALKKEDFDLKNRKITINKTFFEGEIVIPPFKSIIRQVDIPDNLIPMLKKAINNRQEDDFIFYNPKSGAFKIDRQMRKQLAALLKCLNIDKLTFNDLRHTYASNALQSGMSIDYLHKQLGDYSIQATMDKYRDFIV